MSPRRREPQVKKNSNTSMEEDTGKRESQNSEIDPFGQSASEEEDDIANILQKKNSGNVDLPKSQSQLQNPKIQWETGDFVIKQNKRIQDKYFFMKPALGEGLYGRVYKARNQETNVIRAIKAIHKRKARSKNIQNLFNDVEMLKNLDHPNILKVFEFFEDEGYFYIVTEYCSGGDLFETISQQKKFTEKRAAEIIRDILSAIQYCHQKNLVHCDLKPENLLFDSQNPQLNNIKVIDFGNSSFCEPGTTLKYKQGTVYYVAPEVLKGCYDHKCDVWSLGVILFLLLSGKPPFNGATENRIFEKIYKGEYSMEGIEWANISEEAKDLVKSMLTYDYNERPNASKCLEHPWLHNMIEAKEVRLDLPIGRRSLRNLKDFRAKNKLQEAILFYLVNQLTTEDEKNDLLTQFVAIDKDGDGLLSREELADAYAKTGMDPKEAMKTADKILLNVDKSNNGKINYSEFVASTISKRKLFSIDRLKSSFQIFDSENNGFITVESLKSIFSAGVFTTLDDSIWEQMISKFSEEGKISFETFQSMMIQFSENENITQSIRVD